jgi:hypothetical protein
MSRERFVELRRVALQSLKTHHLSGNVEVQLNGAEGVAKVSMVIYRRNPEAEILNTHCLYTFGVEKADGQWAIGSIVQKVFLERWSESHPSWYRKSMMVGIEMWRARDRRVRVIQRFPDGPQSGSRHHHVSTSLPAIPDSRFSRVRF